MDKMGIYTSTTVVDEVQEIQLTDWQEGTATEDKVKITMQCSSGCVNELFKVKLGGKRTGLLTFFVFFKHKAVYLKKSTSIKT